MTIVTLKLVGVDPDHFLKSSADAVQVPVPVLLRVGQNQRARLLKRREQGLDVDGERSAPYSTRGPYYWYPETNSSTPAGKRQALSRLARRLGLRFGRASEARWSTPSAPGGSVVRTGRGFRFASYAHFKEFLRGSSNVDLRGYKAPHMLQALVVEAGGQRAEGDAPASDPGGAGAGISSSTRTADSVSISVYGTEEARRASGHQTGTRTLPRRRFLGASAADREAMANEIMEGMVSTLKASFRK